MHMRRCPAEHTPVGCRRIVQLRSRLGPMVVPHLRSVLVSAEAALHAEGDLVFEVRREFKGAAVHTAVPWTRARRVGTPGPSSWST